MLNAGLRLRTIPSPATERMTLAPGYTTLCAHSGLRAHACSSFRSEPSRQPRPEMLCKPTSLTSAEALGGRGLSRLHSLLPGRGRRSACFSSSGDTARILRLLLRTCSSIFLCFGQQHHHEQEEKAFPGHARAPRLRTWAGSGVRQWEELVPGRVASPLERSSL